MPNKKVIFETARGTIEAELFADEGLLFLDPRDARVAALAAQVLRRRVRGRAEEVATACPVPGRAAARQPEVGDVHVLA